MPNMPLQPSRRAMLKVGAHAAWAVPAIQIAAATPAFAASGDPATVKVEGAFTTSVEGDTTYANADFTVTNQAGNAAVSSILVNFTGNGLSHDAPTEFGPEWTATGRQGGGWSFTRGGTLASGGVAPLTFKIPVGKTSGKPPMYNVTVTVTASNAAPATGSATGVGLTADFS